MMQKNWVCGVELSRLGFGTMRLPVDKAGAIDQAELEKMTQILLFGTLSFSGGVLLYLGLCSGIAGGLVSLLLDAEIISSLRLSSYLFTNLLEVAQ